MAKKHKVSNSSKKPIQIAGVYSHNNKVLGLLLSDDPRVNEELLGGDPLVALQLQNVTMVLGDGSRRVFLARVNFGLDNGTVAGKLLLHRFKDLGVVVLAGNTLHSGKGLSTVTLLETCVAIRTSRVAECERSGDPRM